MHRYYKLVFQYLDLQQQPLAPFRRPSNPHTSRPRSQVHDNAEQRRRRTPSTRSAINSGGEPHLVIQHRFYDIRPKDLLLALRLSYQLLYPDNPFSRIAQEHSFFDTIRMFQEEVVRVCHGDCGSALLFRFQLF